MRQFLLSLAIAITTLVGVTIYYQQSSPALAKDCSANAVVTCGVWSENDLKHAYNNDNPGGTQNIFNGMGIDSQAINNSRIEEGVATRDGRVIVDGQTVANNATSAGRQNIYGSSQRSYGGTIFYETPNQQAFLSEELDVFVLFDEDDMYVGAIIKDCGNPIKANPKTKPKPQPEPEIKEIEVCRLSDKKYPVTIREDQFDSEKHSMNPDDCKEELSPAVSISKKVNHVDRLQVEVGEEFTYQIRITNEGEVDLENVSVTDTAPAGVIFIESSHGTVTNSSWNHTIPQLKVGKYADFTITARATEYISGDLINTACVDAPSVPGNPDDCDDAIVHIPEPEEMIVCRLSDKQYPITIQKTAFDASLYSTDPDDCKEAPTVPELPQTGVADNILNGLGLGSLISSGLAYVASRRHSLIG